MDKQIDRKIDSLIDTYIIQKQNKNITTAIDNAMNKYIDR